MTPGEKIKRIKALVYDLDLISYITPDVMKEEMHECTFYEILETLWELYCFASDVKEVIEKEGDD